VILGIVVYNHYNGNTWDTGDSDTGI
jgi:hypothetical protein